MTSAAPARADEDVAALVFATHLARVRAGAQALEHGWRFTEVDNLHVVVTLTAARPDGEADEYHVMLGGEFYDRYPPTVMFVSPRGAVTGHAGWREAAENSRWLPVVGGLNWFAVHPRYTYPADIVASAGYSVPRQLVCCSMTFEYYISGHNPTPGQQWQQGRHTLGGTIARIQAALSMPYYRGPIGADDS